jgi:adenine-specific DNA glycosylase
MRRDGQILLERRPAGGLFGGLWSPPMSELPAGPAPAATLRRLLRERISDRLGVALRVGGELAAVKRKLTHRELELVAFEVTAGAALEGSGLRWATPLEVDRLGVGSAVQALLASLPPARSGPKA